MRLVHIADTHLGFARHERMTPLGVNQREADVELSFGRVIDMTIALAPEVVVLAGDIFHMVRPKNRTVAHAFRGFKRLRTALPHALIVMVAGNHDMPRSYDMGCALQLFATLGISVIDGPTELLDFPELDLAILAVPENRYARPVLRPEGRRRHNILLLHGETGGISNGRHEGLLGELTDEELHVDEWDYIALGHYHVYKEIAPNEFYAGATDYTSTDIWGELVEEAARGISGKGIVERDLSTGAQTFHPLPCSRVHVDLPPVYAADLGAAAVNAAIEEAVASIGGVAGKVVRLKVVGLERSAKDGLDHKMLRRLKSEAVNFHLDHIKRTVIEFGKPRPVVAPASGSARDMLWHRAFSGEDVRSRTALGHIDRIAGDWMPTEVEAPLVAARPHPRPTHVEERPMARRVVVLPQPPLRFASQLPTIDPYADNFTAADEAAIVASLGWPMDAPDVLLQEAS